MLMYLEIVSSLCVQYMCTTNYEKSVRLTLNITSASILFFSSLLLLLVRVTLFSTIAGNSKICPQIMRHYLILNMYNQMVHSSYLFPFVHEVFFLDSREF